MIILTDIHGNFLTMKALLDKIPQEEKDKGIVVCGDLIDRGPHSREVVQYMIDNNIQCIKGNHESMMVDEFPVMKSHFSRSNFIPNQSLWTMNGGYEALKSYVKYDENDLDDRGVPNLKFDIDTFENHAYWMDILPLYLEFPEIKKDDGRYLVVSHSSINSVWKHRKNADQAHNFEKNILWGRPHTIQDVPEIYNVFGHTPQDYGPKIKVPFANIDTGCFYKEPGYGKLTALQFPEMIIYEQENID